MNKKMKNSAMNHSAISNQQKGVSTLLFTVLVGMSLTALSVGYISSLKTVQNSATTLHAQTQAQMQSMVGLNALNKFLSEQPLSNIQQIKSGNIKTTGVETIKFEMVSSNAGNFVFDITGQSGGASSILRAQYTLIDEVDAVSQSGSIFAGGLRVNKLEDLSANGVTLEVSGGIINKNNNHTYSSSELLGVGITVVPYQPKSFIKPEDVRNDANYIFYSEDGIKKCAKNNLVDTSTIPETKITKETYVGVLGMSACPVGVKFENNNWVFDGATNYPVGIYWFDSNVIVNLPKNNDTRTNSFTSTIIAMGKIKSELLDQKKDSLYEAYAPHHYVINASLADKSMRTNKICSVVYPSQYCDGKGSLKATSLMQEVPALYSNILFLANTIELSAGKEKQHNIVANYYGNIIANGVSGGTGGASGKFTGTGVLNVRGNIMVVGEADMTNMLGDFSMKLSNSDDAGNYVPIYKKEIKMKG